jgi:hypothetical protein
MELKVLALTSQFQTEHRVASERERGGHYASTRGKVIQREREKKGIIVVRTRDRERGRQEREKKNLCQNPNEKPSYKSLPVSLGTSKWIYQVRTHLHAERRPPERRRERERE